MNKGKDLQKHNIDEEIIDILHFYLREVKSGTDKHDTEFVQQLKQAVREHDLKEIEKMKTDRYTSHYFVWLDDIRKVLGGEHE